LFTLSRHLRWLPRGSDPARVAEDFHEERAMQLQNAVRVSVGRIWLGLLFAMWVLVPAAAWADGMREDHRRAPRAEERDHDRWSWLRGHEHRERIYKGYGGPFLRHQFGTTPDDPDRPHNRHYYPYAWGGYGFSAPYFVSRGDYDKRTYERVPYGRDQKYRFGRDHWHEDRWNDGRW
jgi:hypothetical protein